MALRLFFQCRVSSLSQILHKSPLLPITKTSVCLFASDVASKASLNNAQQGIKDAMQYQRLVNNTLEFVLRESLCPESTIDASADNTDNLSGTSQDGKNDIPNEKICNTKKATGLTRKQINHLVMASLTKQGIAELIAQNKNLLRNAWESMSVYCYYVHDTSTARGRFIAQSQLRASNSVTSTSTINTDAAVKGIIDNGHCTETKTALTDTKKSKTEEYDEEEDDDDSDDDMIYWMNWNDVMQDVAKSIPLEGVTESDFVQRIQQHCPLFTTSTFHTSNSVGVVETENNKPSLLPSSASVKDINDSTTNVKNNHADLEGNNNTTNFASVVPANPLLFTPFIFSRKKSLAQWINKHFAHEFIVTRSAVTHLPLYHSRENNSINCDFFSSINVNTYLNAVNIVDKTDKISNIDKNNEKSKLKSEDHVHEELVNALQFALRVIKGDEQAQVPEWTDLNQLLPLIPTHLTQHINSWACTMQHPLIQSVFDTRPFIGLRCKPIHFSVMIIVDLVSETEDASSMLRAMWVERCAIMASSQDNNNDQHNNTSIAKYVQHMADAKLLDYLSSLQILHDLPIKTKCAVKVLCRHSDMKAQETNNKDEKNTANIQTEKNIMMETEKENTNNNKEDENNGRTNINSTTEKQNDHLDHEAMQNKSSIHTYNKTTSTYNNGNNEKKQIEVVEVNKFLEVEHVLGALMETIQSNNNTSSTQLISKNRWKQNHGRVMYDNANSSTAWTSDSHHDNDDDVKVKKKMKSSSCRNKESELNSLERIIVLTTQAKRTVVESVLAEHAHNVHAAVEVRTFNSLK